MYPIVPLKELLFYMYYYLNVLMLSRL
eukprot:Gb_20156 [translate_table: standard]